MKNIMIINENQSIIEDIKLILNDEDISIITVENNRAGISQLNKQNNIDLILVNTNNPNSLKNALMILDPTSDFSTNAVDEKLYLSKPFSKEELTTFIKNNSK